MVKLIIVWKMSCMTIPSRPSSLEVRSVICAECLVSFCTLDVHASRRLESAKASLLLLPCYLRAWTFSSLVQPIVAMKAGENRLSAVAGNLPGHPRKSAACQKLCLSQRHSRKVAGPPLSPHLTTDQALPWRLNISAVLPFATLHTSSAVLLIVPSFRSLSLSQPA